MEVRLVVARRTDVQLLSAELRGRPNHRASKKALTAALGWELEKLDRVVARATADARNSVQIGPGGVVKYLGSESGGRNGIGLYADVSRIVRDHWAPKTFGARECDLYQTARSGRRGAGEWTHPDLVLACFPRRKAHRTDSKELHAFEIEARRGFGIQSIYQAHAQARGADYAWVFTFAAAVDSDDHYERIVWAATETRVGLVEFERSGASTTYRTLLKAGKLGSSRQDRLLFVTRVLGEAEDSALLQGA